MCTIPEPNRFPIQRADWISAKLDISIDPFTGRNPS